MSTTAPGAWPTQLPGATTLLTYAVGVDPVPLTVCVPGRTGGATLEVVLTNATASPITITSIDLLVPVGTSAVDLMSEASGVRCGVSDAGWQLAGPSVDAAGTHFQLTPAQGASGTLDAGASATAVLDNFTPALEPGTANLTLTEQLAGASDTGTATFAITTFPLGFFLDGLLVNVEQADKSLTPVAAVCPTDFVVLTWNSSIVELDAFDIWYSAAPASQTLPLHATVVGRCDIGSLTANTVFTVIAHTKDAAGEPISTSASAVVAVTQPTLSFTSVQTDQAAVTGALTATGATVSLMGTPQNITSSLNGGPYSAPTDGFLVGFINGPTNATVTASCGTTQVGVGWQTAGVAGTFTLPIPANTEFSVSGPSLDELQAALWWVPLGSGAPTPATSHV